MKIGLNKTVITPDTGVDLAGFGRPERKAEGVHDDLYLSSMVMEDDAGRVLIICADLLGFGAELTISLKREIGDKFGFSEDQILLSASHTHSGPQTLENMLSVGKKDEQYIELFKEKAIASVENALKGMFEADIHYGLAKNNSGINRRRPSDGIIEFAPYEDGITDNDVTVLKVVKDGSIKAVLYNYTCHPSIIDSNFVSADYPGRARLAIEDAFGKDVGVFFIQGCCGDIRARTIEDHEFRSGTWEDVDEYGLKLGNIVINICRTAMQKLDVRISSGIMKVMLPLKALPERRDLVNMLEKGTRPEMVWAGRMLSDYDSLKTELPFTVQRISLGERFHIIALSGEVCVEYASYIKQKDEKRVFIAAGYSNGVTGYIPTGLMLEQGGYEPEGSIIYYGMPSQFDRSVEKIVKKAIDDITRENLSDYDGPTHVDNLIDKAASRTYNVTK